MPTRTDTVRGISGADRAGLTRVLELDDEAGAVPVEPGVALPTCTAAGSIRGWPGC